jgi:tetratricopeptide (TPR) repeat protein
VTEVDMTTPQRLACLFLALALAPAAARADNKEDAKVHVANATQAHKAGHYDEARLELEAAYALDPDPAVLYALGQVHAKLGHCREATAYFTRFAAAQKDPQVSKIVDQAIAACTPAAAPASQASAASPDAAPQASSPPSTGTVPQAPARPFAPTRSASSPAPIPAPARAASSPASAPASTRGASSPAPTTAPAEAPQPTAWYRDKLGDGLVIGGLVAGVLGLIEYRGARSDLDAAENRTTTTTLDRYNDLLASAHDKRTASIVLFGAGSALIAGGVLRYVLHDRDREARSVGVAPARGGAVVSFGGPL